MEGGNVVLVAGGRAGFGWGGRGKLVATGVDEAGAHVLRGLRDRHPKLDDTMIEDIGLGNVAGQGEFVLLASVQRLAGLPLAVCAFNSYRQCGSSLETQHRLSMSIMIGAYDFGITHGSERMARALHGCGGETQPVV